MSPKARWRIGVLAAVALVGILALGATLESLGVRRTLEAGRSSLLEGRERLSAGDAAAALEAFEQARSEFTSARSEMGSVWLRVPGWVPYLGRTIDTAEALASAGADVSGAGARLAEAIETLPGGADALAPDRGRVPIEHLETLAPVVGRAAAEVENAVGDVAASPTSPLIGPVARIRDEAEEELGSLAETLTTSSMILEGLPEMLGAEGARRYFFGAQNPAELRGTGGIIGAFAILTVDGGRFRFGPFLPTNSLPKLDVADVPAPSPEFAENYDQFRSQGRFWTAINVTPDFPSAARAIVTAYEAATDETIDGVIVADPFAMQALLRLTGPAPVPGLDLSVDADGVVDFMANEAYSLVSKAEDRKRLLGDVAQSVVGRFLAGAGGGVRDLRVLAEASGEGHILAYSVDARMQRALERTGAGGALAAPTGDFLSIVENSAGSNKTDFYEQRTIGYGVELGGDGSARSSVLLSLRNDAPASGEPKYVIGPFKGFSRAGEGNQILSVYAASGSTLVEASRDGSRISVIAGSELGHPFYQDHFRTPSGETSTLSLDWHRSLGWEGDDTGGVYRLTFLGQTTIRPAQLRVEIQAPPGMRIVEASTGMDVNDGSATWAGTPNRRLEVEVRFEPPTLLRLWRELGDLLVPG